MQSEIRKARMQNKASCPLDRPHTISLSSLTQEGKTTFLKHWIATGMLTPDEYRQLHQETAITAVSELEASFKLK